MKKIYFAPTAKVVELKAQVILAGSDIDVDPSQDTESMDSMRDIDFEDGEDY